MIKWVCVLISCFSNVTKFMKGMMGQMGLRRYQVNSSEWHYTKCMKCCMKNVLMLGHFWFLIYIFSVQGPDNRKRYQIHLKSTHGPIYVILVNKDDSSSSPVVVPVPPHDLQSAAVEASLASTTKAAVPSRPVAGRLLPAASVPSSAVTPTAAAAQVAAPDASTSTPEVTTSTAEKEQPNGSRISPG